MHSHNIARGALFLPFPQTLTSEQEFTHLSPFWALLVASCKTSLSCTQLRRYIRPMKAKPETKQKATQTLLALHF